MTSVQYITDADADPVPKKWGIKVGFFKELLLEFLGNTEEHVGYVRFIGVSEKLGSELLESYTQAPTIASLVNVARTSMPTVRNELRELESDKKRHIRGKPDDKTPRDRREQEAKTWYQDERKRLGYPGPQVLNVFDLRAAQLQNISGGKYSGPQFPSSRHTPPGTPAPSDTGVSVALGSRQTRRNNPAPSQPFESYIGRLTQESIDTLRNNGFGYQRLHGVFQGFGVTPQEILDRLEKGESTDQIMRSFR
jgi:hypothetical protein